MARALVNLALEPQLNKMILAEGGAQLLLNLARSPHAEVAHWARHPLPLPLPLTPTPTPYPYHQVAHWARVAQGNIEAAAALGPLVRHCPQDSPVEPIDMVTMSSLV